MAMPVPTSAGPRRARRRRAAAALLAAAAVLAGACSGSSVAHTSAIRRDAGATNPTGGRAPGTALALLATLAVKGRAPKTGYTRALFGEGWDDPGHNGCTTREAILRRDLHPSTVAGGCVVIAGTLHDPYTGKTIAFTRGSRTSTAVQIDHVVALGDAWQKGAQGWDPATRRRFANDPLELLAVDGPTNTKKGEGDAATWLPPDKSFRCAYVARQVAVKAAYRLWVTSAEHDAIAHVLDRCPDEPVPTASLTGALGFTSTSSPQDREPASPTSTITAPVSSSAARSTTSPDTYYSSCAAARAAGVAPLHRGDPGYRSGLDRDNDGIACE